MSAYATQLSELSKQNLLEETLRQHDKAAVLSEKLAALLADVDAALAGIKDPRGALGPRISAAVTVLTASVTKARS